MRKRKEEYIDPIRLWKDEKYRKQFLTAEQLAEFESESALIKREGSQFTSAQLKGNPAGVIELSDEELRQSAQVDRICSKYASISTTWCDNPRTC